MSFPRASGILLHPTSLPDQFGIGDLGGEAYQFADFLVSSGQRVWQILPLGPTGYSNSPYQCLSVFAGNPLLISLEGLVRDRFLEPADLEDVPSFPKDRVDYGSVIKFKMPLLKKSFETFGEKAAPNEREQLAVFCLQNASWLETYSLFMALKEAHGLAPWNTWEEDVRRRQPKFLEHWSKRLNHEISCHKYQQFQFFKQWSELKKYCNERGIRLIGDMPIFISLDSAEVWSHPEMFHLDTSGKPTVVAGVPPDYFSKTGQLWGNPIYRWDVMAKDGYAWWIERFRATHALVDIIRLDHFRGFEKYWEVPGTDTTAMNGRWVPGPGLELFNALQKALGTLPIIAEDLGIITPEVDALREQLELPGMRVLQFAFGSDPKADDYKPHNGSWSAWCANGGSSGLDPAFNNYPVNMNSWMIYGPFDLSDAVDAELLFYYWNESETGSDDFKWYASPNGTNWYGYAVSGNSGGWQYVNFDLTDVYSIGNLCGDSSVWIAFKFDSDYINNYKGAFVDDIILQKATDPNLTPYQPSLWADKIVVSNHQGDHDDDSPLYDTDTLYIDWAVINNGAVATEDTFYTRLYVDGILEATWYTDPPMEPGYYAYVSDCSIGSFSAGSHTIKIVTDYDDRITETDENDNEYQKTINIGTTPQISSISPAIASAGTDTTVTINGSNFGTTQGSSKVEFFYRSGEPKIEAPIVSWSDAQIQCIVPVDIVNAYAVSSSSGPVTVTTDSGTSNGYIFKVTFGYGEVEWPETHPWIFY